MHTPSSCLPANRRIVERLLEAARLLEASGASRYRVGAFRAAAQGVAAHPRPLATVFAQQGVKGLDAIPGVGLGIAAAIGEMLATGRWSFLRELRQRGDPIVVFQCVPGMGPTLARRLATGLGVDSLEALYAAAVDGRLQALRGVGARRASCMRAVLAEMLAMERQSGPRSGNMRP